MNHRVSTRDTLQPNQTLNPHAPGLVLMLMKFITIKEPHEQV